MTGTKSKTMQTAVLGVSGYAGAELARLLLHHPRLHDMAPVFFGRESENDARIALTDLHPQLADNNGSGHGSAACAWNPFTGQHCGSTELMWSFWPRRMSNRAPGCPICSRTACASST